MKAKITWIQDKQSNSTKKILVLIPGGPGISSQTLRTLDVLKNDFNLAYIDYITERNSKPSYEEILQAYVEEIIATKTPVILCGHSFGGIFTSELALNNKLNVEGLICLDTPFSGASFKSCVDQYNIYKNEELIQAEKEWEDKPSDQTFKNWLASYRELYFKKENIQRGREMLLKCEVYHEQFLGARNIGDSKESLLDKVKDKEFTKLFITGSEDLLLLSEVLKKDADRGDFIFKEVSDAGHFVHFDQPMSVAKLIKDYFIGDKKGQCK